MLSKKGVSPVIATILLLFVAVVLVVTFMAWFDNYINFDIEDPEFKVSYTEVCKYLGYTDYSSVDFNDYCHNQGKDLYNLPLDQYFIVKTILIEEHERNVTRVQRN